MTAGDGAGIPRTGVLVANLKAGAGRVTDPGRLRAAIAARGVEIVQELPVPELDRLGEWVQGPREGRPMVIAAGGDGTVGSVVDHLADTGTVLGVVPTGTSNNVARSLGLPLDLDAAIGLFADGKVATVELGHLQEDSGRSDYFVQAATVGLHTEFAKLATQRSLRRVFGRTTYLAATVGALRRTRPFLCTLQAGDRELSLRLVHLSVINAPVFGGNLGFQVAGSHFDDRRLDAIAVEAMPVSRLARLAILMGLGRVGDQPGVHTFRAPAITVASEERLDVGLDGEVHGSVPGRFEVAPNALHVVTPQEFEDLDVPDPVSARR
ncbi:MAG: YegS/Rv2252/BmrU family lipid kinase [Candidatus Dormibacteraeota bacterium]|nr:YegS/Rv2252/BmrU family lipid kinase [Candidatus Dormibacteraeota bacterium]MBO0760696.1 YegS/Rv2252/BmrU family lipid kinase [Candidatus Dormibacteraeota bacterium]